MAAKTVDEYIAGLDDWQGDVVSGLREIVLSAAPQAAEKIKWAQPVYEEKGPFSFIKAFKNHVNFGFWRGVQLPDPEGLLEGSGEKMRHIKVRGLEDIKREPFEAFVREAVKLNIELGDPTKG
jgi:hypothetical protein